MASTPGKIVLAGECMASRTFSQCEDPEFLQVIEKMRAADLTMAHLEMNLGDPEEIVAYCHSGSRSALATLALRLAGYRARNYAGSWHEWSRHDDLPFEKG